MQRQTAAATYRIPPAWVAVIVVFPFVADALALVFLRLDATHEAARWMLKENRPVELLTFLFLATGAILGLTLARQARRQGEKPAVYLFYATFAAGLAFVAGEEIAWGQQLLRFETPDAIMEVNRQGELTLHNIGELQGRSSYMRFIFGFGGLVGVSLAHRETFRRIAPPTILLSYFLVITFFSTLGMYKDVTDDRRLYNAFSLRPLSELNEMLTGLSATLFIWLNSRTFQQPWGLAPVNLGDDTTNTAPRRARPG